MRILTLVYIQREKSSISSEKGSSTRATAPRLDHHPDDVQIESHRVDRRVYVVRHSTEISSGEYVVVRGLE